MNESRLTKITMIYNGQEIERYFKNIQNFDYLYPDAKILKNESITDKALIEKIYKIKCVL